MTIAAEDITRMKQIAKDSLEKTPQQIYDTERDFLADMEPKYGVKESIRLLTKIWELSARMKEQAEQW